MFAIHVAAAGIGDDELPVVPLLFGTVVWGGAWVLGDRIRQRRVRRGRAGGACRCGPSGRPSASAASRAAEERTRIARDLHDSAGHAINVILVQAGRRTAAAGAGSTASEGRARDDRGGRTRDAGRDRPARPSSPRGRLRERECDRAAPGLAALETLTERHRTSGLAVVVQFDGSRRHLAPAVDRTAYRILQEALTNAARHGSGSADVEIAFAEQALELTVTNPSPRQRNVRPTGHGLVGMRERTELLGGSFEAASEEGLFRIRARLPYDGGERRRS